MKSFTAFLFTYFFCIPLNNIAQNLVANPILKSRINYIGYGSSNPAASNGTDEGKQQNRRVEFIINKN